MGVQCASCNRKRKTKRNNESFYGRFGITNQTRALPTLSCVFSLRQSAIWRVCVFEWLRKINFLFLNRNNTPPETKLFVNAFQGGWILRRLVYSKSNSELSVSADITPLSFVYQSNRFWDNYSLVLCLLKGAVKRFCRLQNLKIDCSFFVVIYRLLWLLTRTSHEESHLAKLL